MKISYISNIKLSESSGGMSGINHAVYHQLKRFFNIEDYIYINAKEDRWAKIKSKMLRILGFKGNYHFFSNNRLNQIRKTYNKHQVSGDAYFFFGFTSWIDIEVTKPYYCYNDASFATYVDIYNNKSEFSEKDLERIYQKEKKWLQNAQLVFFNSDWALEKTKKEYHIEGDNFINVGLGGFIDINEKDFYKEGFNFLFISKEFKPKGGRVVAEAIDLVRQKYPTANVWVVGDSPPEDLKNQPGLDYKGFFSKSNSKSLKDLTSLFDQSFCIIHPTIKDINPLVIFELAYYGSPAIASNRFAIPEFVEDKVTGLLLDNPRDAGEVAAKMCYMIEHPNRYKAMRKQSREKALAKYTWDKMGDRLNTLIQP